MAGSDAAAAVAGRRVSRGRGAACGPGGPAASLAPCSIPLACVPTFVPVSLHGWFLQALKSGVWASQLPCSFFDIVLATLGPWSL